MAPLTVMWATPCTRRGSCSLPCGVCGCRPCWLRASCPNMRAGTQYEGGHVVVTRPLPRCLHLDPRRPPPAHLLPPVEQALAAVHTRGVAHRDIRCENVLVQEGEGEGVVGGEGGQEGVVEEGEGDTCDRG